MVSDLPADPNSVAYTVFDSADDDIILAEIQQRNLEILDKLVYSYQDRRGATITGLSLTGVRETVRELNRRGLARIKVTSAPPIIRETDDFIDVIVYAEDELNGGGNFGSKRQAKTAGNYANPFAFEQALSKAQRNALFGLIPGHLVVEMIKQYADQGRTKVLSGPVRPQIATAAPRPPAALSGPSGGTSEPPPWPEQHAEDTAAAPPDVTPQHRMEPEAAITEPQMRLLQKLLKDLGVTEEQKGELKKRLEVEHWPELSKRQATELIDKLIARQAATKAPA